MKVGIISLASLNFSLNFQIQNENFKKNRKEIYTLEKTKLHLFSDGKCPFCLSDLELDTFLHIFTHASQKKQKYKEAQQKCHHFCPKNTLYCAV